jgi:hypothetical protein
MRSARRAAATGAERPPKAAVGQGETVGRALGEGSAEAEGGLESKELPEAEGVASAVHTVPVGLVLARDVLEELALGLPDEDTVLLGVCEGVPNGVRMPLGVGMVVPVCVPEPLGVGPADTVLLGVGLADTVVLGVGLGVPVGEPVCVIFGVPVPLGVALSVGHRLTRPPPPAGAL